MKYPIKNILLIFVLLMSSIRIVAINMIRSSGGDNGIFVTSESNTTLRLNENLTVKSLAKIAKTKKIFICEEADGFRYFVLQDKYGAIGIADLNGNIIIPMDNKAIYYFPALNAGYSEIEFPINRNEAKTTNEPHTDYLELLGVKDLVKENIDAPESPQKDKAAFSLYHSKRKATFFCQRLSDCAFYTTEGEIIANIKSIKISILPGYVILGDDYLYDSTKYTEAEISTSMYDRNNDKYLYTSDGTLVVGNTNEIGFYLSMYKEDSFLKYGRNVAKTGVATKYGAFKLENMSDSIPCKFYAISIVGKDWYVTQTSMDKSEKYIVSQNHEYYRDKGQEYYEQRKYDEVIQFYAKEGIAASWAKFYTGVALCKKGLVETEAAKTCTALINKYDEMPSFTFDLDIAKQLLSTSVKALESYIKEDTIYASWAETYKNFAEEGLKEIPAIEKKYSLALNTLKERQEKARIAEIQRKREEQQRKIQERNALLVGILGGFAKALLPNNGSTHSSQSSYVTGNTFSNSSPSNGKDNAHRQEWLQRKANAEKQLQYYQEKLKKDPNNAALKHNIRTQQEIIQNCNNML